MQSHREGADPPEVDSTIGIHEPSADPELKKAFTAFHNASQFAKDAASPFLGDDPLKSSYYLGHDPAAPYMTSLSHHHHNYHQQHPSSAMMQLMIAQAGGGGRGGCSVPQHGE